MLCADNMWLQKAKFENTKVLNQLSSNKKKNA